MAITANTTTSALSAKSLIGTRVLNPKGENLGKLEDIVIEPEDGRVSFGIVSFGGFLGVGERLYAVPLQAMKTSPEERAFVLNVDKEKLKNAPGFDKDKWPDLSDRAYDTTVYTFYGSRPYWH